MGYLIKSNVINAVEEDMRDVMMCYEEKQEKDIIAFCYESIQRTIEDLPQYRPDNVFEDTGLTPEQICSIATELKEYKRLGLSPKRLSEHVAFCRRYHELFGAIDFNQLMELKERDTAKAAIITGYNRAIGCKVGECPTCGAMTRDYLEFCSECGQRIKWED